MKRITTEPILRVDRRNDILATPLLPRHQDPLGRNHCASIKIGIETIGRVFQAGMCNMPGPELLCAD